MTLFTVTSPLPFPEMYRVFFVSVSWCTFSFVVPQILFRARWRCMSHLMHGSCEELHLSSSPTTEECQCSLRPCLMALEITPGSSSGWHFCFSPQERGSQRVGLSHAFVVGSTVDGTIIIFISVYSMFTWNPAFSEEKDARLNSEFTIQVYYYSTLYFSAKITTITTHNPV